MCVVCSTYVLRLGMITRERVAMWENGSEAEREREREREVLLLLITTFPTTAFS